MKKITKILSECYLGFNAVKELNRLSKLTSYDVDYEKMLRKVIFNEKAHSFYKACILLFLAQDMLEKERSTAYKWEFTNRYQSKFTDYLKRSDKKAVDCVAKYVLTFFNANLDKKSRKREFQFIGPSFHDNRDTFMVIQQNFIPNVISFCSIKMRRKLLGAFHPWAINSTELEIYDNYCEQFKPLLYFLFEDGVDNENKVSADKEFQQAILKGVKSSPKENLAYRIYPYIVQDAIKSQEVGAKFVYYPTILAEQIVFVIEHYDSFPNFFNLKQLPIIFYIMSNSGEKEVTKKIMLKLCEKIISKARIKTEFHHSRMSTYYVGKWKWATFLIKFLKKFSKMLSVDEKHKDFCKKLDSYVKLLQKELRISRASDQLIIGKKNEGQKFVRAVYQQFTAVI